MEIPWTEEEARALAEAYGTEMGRDAERPRTVRDGYMAVASKAVSLFLARASGQVKDDNLKARLAMTLQATPDEHRGGVAALSRLAALAQKAEAFRASADELERQRDSRGEALDVADETITALRAKVAELEALKNGSDTALREESRLRQEAETQARLAWERHAEKDRAYGAALGDRDDARATAERERQRADTLHRTWQGTEKELKEARSEAERLKAEIGAIHTAVFTGMPEPVTSDDGVRIVAEIALLQRRAAELGDIARQYRDGRTDARAEVERLTTTVKGLTREREEALDRAARSESRLAVIRTALDEHDAEEGPDLPTTLDQIREALDCDAPQEVTCRDIVDSWARGDAPNASTGSNGSDVAPQETRNVTRLPVTPEMHAALDAVLPGMEGDAPHRAKKVPPCICGFLSGQCNASRHPCSPTCTHDDAATPGHPERVKERGAEFKAAMAKHVETADAVARARKEGAEAMRAACWEAAQDELRLHGWGPGDGPWTRLKAAIEGAAP